MSFQIDNSLTAVMTALGGDENILGDLAWRDYYYYTLYKFYKMQ